MFRRATRWTALAVAAAALFSATGLADDVKVEGDLKKFQGTWVNEGGDGPETTWEVKGDDLTATVNGEEYRCKIKLDPGATPHPSADIEIKEGPGDSAGSTSRGIYKFEDDRLLLCVGLPGRDLRPTEFVTVEDESYSFKLRKKD